MSRKFWLFETSDDPDVMHYIDLRKVVSYKTELISSDGDYKLSVWTIGGHLFETICEHGDINDFEKEIDNL